MARYLVVLFDLEGTLIDPKLGITKSVREVLRSRSPSVQHFITESGVAFLKLAPHD